MLGSASAGRLNSTVPIGGSSIYLIVDSDEEVDRLHQQAVLAGAMTAH